MRALKSSYNWSSDVTNVVVAQSVPLAQFYPIELLKGADFYFT